MNKMMSEDPGLIVNSQINFEFFDLSEKDRLRLKNLITVNPSKQEDFLQIEEEKMEGIKKLKTEKMEDE